MTDSIIDALGRLAGGISQPRGSSGGGVLVVSATAMEAQAVAGLRVEVLVTGVGKSSSAAVVAKRLAAGGVGVVLDIGIAGSLPGSQGHLAVGSVIAATGHAFADEGVATPVGFVPLSALGFGPSHADGMTFRADAGVLGVIGRFADCCGVIATVSTCSGTDAMAAAVAERTGAAAEAMEGASVAAACRLFGVPMGELRAISNRTGDRERQQWDIPRAMAALKAAMCRRL